MCAQRHVPLPYLSFSVPLKRNDVKGRSIDRRPYPRIAIRLQREAREGKGQKKNEIHHPRDKQKPARAKVKERVPGCLSAAQLFEFLRRVESTKWNRTFNRAVSGMIDRNRASFFPVADGNAAGTGPGDPWTGSGGGVQPPYSGYAPPHLAQSAYSMHLPHDPMVSVSPSLRGRRLLYVFLFLVSVPVTFSSLVRPPPPRSFPLPPNGRTRRSDQSPARFRMPRVVRTTPPKLGNRHGNVLSLSLSLFLNFCGASDTRVGRGSRRIET